MYVKERKMSGKSFIPSKEAEFDVWFGNLIQYVNTQCSGTPPAWTHIPPEALERLNNAGNAWHAAYAKTLKPYTSVDTEEKNRLHAAAIPVIQDFVNEFLRYSSYVTDEDMANMGMRRRKKGRRIEVPTTWPELIADTSVRCRISIYYRDAGSSRRGKPENVHGIEIRWAILDHYPTSLSELINSSFDTKQPLVLDFDESDRGKHVYMYGRWEIEREGEKGPPSAIIDVIVP
jgi:hypothetical protein